MLESRTTIYMGPKNSGQLQAEYRTFCCWRRLSVILEFHCIKVIPLIARWRRASVFLTWSWIPFVRIGGRGTGSRRLDCCCRRNLTSKAPGPRCPMSGCRATSDCSADCAACKWVRISLSLLRFSFSMRCLTISLSKQSVRRAACKTSCIIRIVKSG